MQEISSVETRYFVSLNNLSKPKETRSIVSLQIKIMVILKILSSCLLFITPLSFFCIKKILWQYKLAHPLRNLPWCQQH